MYILRRKTGVRGLLLINMAWRYGEIWLGAVILVIFSFVYIGLGIIAKMPPLAIMGPSYMFLFICYVVGIVVYDFVVR